jgi:6-phosphogluconolactonase (cycloisomerase 2 family)
MTAPAQIGFSPDGRFLLVTEKATDSIDTFRIGHDGYASGLTVNPAPGRTPFAFAFGKRDLVFVSEVFGGDPEAGAVSSFRLMRSGQLQVIAASVPNTETAPCWLVATRGGRYVYTTNTPSDSLSGFEVERDGGLRLLDPGGRTGEPGMGTRPLDMDLSADGRFLFTLNIGNNTLSTFRVMPDGALVELFQTGGVPSGTNGLAVR